MLESELNGAAACRFVRDDARSVGWAVSEKSVDYPTAVAAMEARVQAIAEGRDGELVWLLEHPPLYTAGVSAKPHDLIDPAALPVFASGRGGQYTYHGPGQRVAYVMLDLTRRGHDVRCFVAALEAWIVATLATLGVAGEIRPGRVGVWVAGPGGEEQKIAAVGVKLRRWISFHGISLNVAPDLAHYAGIVPCGETERGVTSLAALGVMAEMTAVDAALEQAFAAVFGPVEPAPPLF